MDYSRENASRLAAELFVRNILRILSTAQYVLKDLNNACLPFLAIDWNRKTRIAIAGKRLNELMRMLRLSQLDMATYRLILTVIKINDTDHSQISPFDLENWRRIIVRFNLNDEVSFPEWLVLIRIWDGHLITSPGALASLSLLQLKEIFSTDPNFNSIIQLWQPLRFMPTRQLLLPAMRSILALTRACYPNRPGARISTIRVMPSDTPALKVSMNFPQISTLWAMRRRFRS